MARKRVLLTFDDVVYRQFQQALKENGYSRHAVAIMLQDYMRRVVKDYYDNGLSPDLVMFDARDQLAPGDNLLIVHPSEPAKITCTCGWSGLPADASDDGLSHPFVCPLCGADLIP